MRLNNLECVLDLWWFFFGTVIGELFAGEIRGREELLSPHFRDYLRAAYDSLAAAAHDHPERFVGMCTARDRERAKF